MTRKWNIFNDQSNANYEVGNEIIYNTEVLKSNLCHYNDTYIFAEGDITTVGRNLATEVAFKNCAPFTKCIAIHDVEDLELVMSLYNLLEYSSNYSDTTCRLWFYLKDLATNFNADIEEINNLNLSSTRLNY